MFDGLSSGTLSTTDFAVGYATSRRIKNHTGETFVGESRLAEDTGLSVRTVRNSIRKLEATARRQIHDRRAPEGAPTLTLTRIR